MRGLERVYSGKEETGCGGGRGAIVMGVDGSIGVFQPEFGDKCKAIELEVGGEGGGYDTGRSGKLDAFLVIEIFCAEAQPVPGFGVDTAIECGSPPAAGGGVFFAGQAGFIEAAVEAEA